MLEGGIVIKVVLDQLGAAAKSIGCGRGVSTQHAYLRCFHRRLQPWHWTKGSRHIQRHVASMSELCQDAKVSGDGGKLVKRAARSWLLASNGSKDCFPA